MKKRYLAIILIISLGITCTLFDYLLVQKDKFPIFTISITHNNYETKLGLGYKLTREITKTFNEPLSNSKNVRFGSWLFTKKIEYNFSKSKNHIAFTYQKSNIKNETFFKNNNVTYFLSDLDNLTINYQNKSFNFKDGIKNKKISLKEIFSLAKSTKIYKNYGYKIYYYDNLKIYKCHTTYENNELLTNVLITNDKNSIDKTFCDSTTCLFKQSIKIIKKLDNNLVNIKLLNNNNLITVKLSDEVFNQVLINQEYNFTFKTNNVIEYNDYEELFKTPIIKIETITSKEQINNQDSCL